MNGFVSYNLPNQTNNQPSILSTAESSATASAKQFAGLNAAGGVSSLTLLTATSSSASPTPAATTPSAGSTVYPNTVKVTVRRDSTANTSLGLFFAPVLGIPTANLNATASATIYAANIDSFTNVSSQAVGLLPVTYDVNNWNNFLTTGQDPDGNSPTLDANGNPDLTVYPSVKDTGNFGLLGLDDSHAGASTVSSWITSGLTQTDVQNLLNNSANDQTPLIPLSQHNQNILPSASTDGMGSWNWVGDTGMKTSVEHTLDELRRRHLPPAAVRAAEPATRRRIRRGTTTSSLHRGQRQRQPLLLQHRSVRGREAHLRRSGRGAAERHGRQSELGDSLLRRAGGDEVGRRLYHERHDVHPTEADAVREDRGEPQRQARRGSPLLGAAARPTQTETRPLQRPAPRLFAFDGLEQRLEVALAEAAASRAAR